MAFGVIGMFGALPFYCSQEYILTFKDMARSSKMRFAKHDVIGKKPVLEKIGEDLRTVSFSMRLDSSLLRMPVAAAILLYTKLLEQGEAQTLIIGGEIMGKYVIESIEENRKFFTGLGVCIGAELTFSLMEAG
jgi:phage protein U